MKKPTDKKAARSGSVCWRDPWPGFWQDRCAKTGEAELTYQKIGFETKTPIPVNYLGETIRIYKMRHLLVERSIVCGVTALQEALTHHDISTIKSYLRGLGLKTGLAVNFGKSKLEIRGVRGD